MPATHSQFTPSATVTAPVQSMPTQLVLPPVDAGNTAVVLRNQGPGTVTLIAGTTQNALGGLPGAITLMPGQTVLANSPGLSSSTAATATAQGGAVLQVWRGSLADVWLFPPQPVAVF